MADASTQAYMVEKECLQCKKKFSVVFARRNKAKFCSKNCYDISQTTSERRELECERCGNKFITKMDHGEWPRFCSRKCFCDGAVNKPQEKQCPVCESMFFATYSSHKQGSPDGLRTYCSRKCANESSKNGTNKICLNCGGEFYLNMAHVRQRNEQGCCSDECQREFYRRERSKFWKGGKFVQAHSGHILVNAPRPNRVSEYVGEHRLVAFKKIGRILDDWESVIHINGDKKDNAPDNLFVCGSRREMRYRFNGRWAWPKKSNLDKYK